MTEHETNVNVNVNENENSNIESSIDEYIDIHEQLRHIRMKIKRSLYGYEQRLEEFNNDLDNIFNTVENHTKILDEHSENIDSSFDAIDELEKFTINCNNRIKNCIYITVISGVSLAFIYYYNYMNNLYN